MPKRDPQRNNTTAFRRLARVLAINTTREYRPSPSPPSTSGGPPLWAEAQDRSLKAYGRDIVFIGQQDHTSQFWSQ
jgi:hypothetical protein